MFASDVLSSTKASDLFAGSNMGGGPSSLFPPVKSPKDSVHGSSLFNFTRNLSAALPIVPTSPHDVAAPEPRPSPPENSPTTVTTVATSSQAVPKPRLNPPAVTRPSVDTASDPMLPDTPPRYDQRSPSSTDHPPWSPTPSTMPPPQPIVIPKPKPPPLGQPSDSAPTPKKAGGVFSSLKMVTTRNSNATAKRNAVQQQTARNKSVLNREYPSLHDFNVLRTIGTGGFGRVKLVQHKATKQYFALKMLSKAEIIRAKQVQHVLSERGTLEKLQHPFIIRLHSTYQDTRYIYMLMEYVVGGDFFSHLRAQSRFPLHTARHYAATIVLALDYVHAQGVAYRDLKPENLLLDSKGVLKMTDFGLCKAITAGERTWTLCGTPEYLAPEIILTKGHGHAVDWWALGVLIYEFIAGYPPFYDESPYKIYEKVLIGKVEFPCGFDEDAMDLVSKLLRADLVKRYGNMKRGALDIMNHKFFKSIDWAALTKGAVKAPITPMVSHDGDTRNFDEFPEEESLPDEVFDNSHFKGF